MTLTIEIDEQEIADTVKELVVDRAATQIHREMIGNGEHFRYQYHTLVREIIREVLKDNYDVLAKEAVDAAAKSIENRAVKNKLLKALEE